MTSKTPEKRLEFFTSAYRKSFSLFSAAEIGLFDYLYNEYKPYNVIAQDLKVSPNRLKPLLDLLSFNEFLEKEGDSYRIHLDFLELADKNRKDNLSARLAHPSKTAKSWFYLTKVLKEDKSSHDLEERPPHTDKDIMDFHRSLGSRGEIIMNHYVKNIPHDDNWKIADIGGGFGDLCLPFVKDKNIQVEVFDNEDTARLAAQYMAKTEWDDNYTFHGCDFINDSLPAGFNLCLVSNILHIYSENECVELLSRLHKSILDDGYIFIREITINDEATAPESGLEFSLHMAINTRTGKAHSKNAVTEFLEKAGFSNITTLTSPTDREYALLAKKVKPLKLEAQNTIA